MANVARGGRDSAMEFAVSAPGKIIVSGEHAVVHGTLAVATVVDLRTRVAVHRERRGRPVVNFHVFGQKYTWTAKALMELASEHSPQCNNNGTQCGAQCW